MATAKKPSPRPTSATTPPKTRTTKSPKAERPARAVATSRAKAGVATSTAPPPVAAQPGSRSARNVDELLLIGQEVLGIPGYRPGQRPALEAILAGKDVLAVMPTGAGKSLLYQLPSLILPGLTVVVSPLLALIKDQIDKMVRRGVAVVRIDSTLTVKQRREMDALAKAPGGKLLLTTPERMADPEFRTFLRECAGNLGVSRFVVDEAHCVSQWGHDFRPAYLSLRKAIDDLGRPPVLATTATAPPHVRDDILHQLGCEDATIVTTTFERANLHFEVIPFPGEDDKVKTLVTLLKKLPRPGIVYCATVKKVEDLAETLFRHGLPVTYYHGRLTKNEREANQQKFMDSKDVVMIATNAFGLGVDKQDIRNVIHYHVPGSLEAYAQEAGRGGRDAKPARCILLFSPDDVAIQEYFLSGSYPTRRQVNQVYAALEAFGKAGAHTRTPEQGPTIANVALGSGVGQQRTRTVLALFKEEKFVNELEGGYFELAYPPPTPEVLRDRARQYEARRIADRQRLDALLAYVNAAGCRNQVILDYLGEPDAPACGRCDNCLRSRDASLAAAKESKRLGESLTRLLDEEGETAVTAPVRPARYKLIRVDEHGVQADAAAAPVVPAPSPALPAAPSSLATDEEAADEDDDLDDDEEDDEFEDGEDDGDDADDEDDDDEDEDEDDFEDIQRTAAELADEGYESGDAITILARKRVPKAPKPKRRFGQDPAAAAGGPGAAGAPGEEPLGDGTRKKRRRRRKKKAVLPPPSAFSSPIITSVVSPPPRARYAGAPVVEYVRGPIRIDSAPAASANPNEAGRRRPGNFARPSGGGGGARSQNGTPTGGGGGNSSVFVRRDAFVPGAPATADGGAGAGNGRRRRRRGRGGGGGGGGARGPGQQNQQGFQSGQNGAQRNERLPLTGSYGAFDGAPAGGGFGGPPVVGMSGFGGAPGASAIGGGPVGGDGRKRRRRRRRGGGGGGGGGQGGNDISPGGQGGGDAGGDE